jgi:hypothetical protein
LALAAHEDLEIHHMDVNTAFLYGTLDEEIYMKQPQGFADPNHPEHVCLLKKSIYGLKQAPRVWNTTINNFLTQQGFKKTSGDPCLYIKTTSQGKAIIFLYVDDLLIVTSSSLLQSTKDMLAKRFSMKDLGEAHSLLGIEIHRDRTKKTITIQQTAYLHDILNSFGMDNCKPASTPIETGTNLPKPESTPAEAEKLLFQQTIGKLIYAASGT